MWRKFVNRIWVLDANEEYHYRINSWDQLRQEVLDERELETSRSPTPPQGILKRPPQATVARLPQDNDPASGTRPQANPPVAAALPTTGDGGGGNPTAQPPAITPSTSATEQQATAPQVNDQQGEDERKPPAVNTTQQTADPQVNESAFLPNVTTDTGRGDIIRSPHTVESQSPNDLPEELPSEADMYLDEGQDDVSELA